ncbi:hypothetical protein D3C85_1481220 [compost metagenome]
MLIPFLVFCSCGQLASTEFGRNDRARRHVDDRDLIDNEIDCRHTCDLIHHLGKANERLLFWLLTDRLQRRIHVRIEGDQGG